MKAGTNREKALKIILAVVLLGIALVLATQMNRAMPVGGIDEGRLFLAGATSIMKGEGFSITQRTPLYSLLLAGLGAMYGVDPSDTVEGAHEYGSINNLPVARGFLQHGYQRIVLLLNLSIWAASLLLFYSSVRNLNFGRAWALFALILFTSVSWILVTYIYDPILTQFLLLLGVFAWIRWLNSNRDNTGPLLVSALSFALAALSRPAFQILSICLLIVAFPLVRTGRFALQREPRNWKKASNQFAAFFLGAWVLVVGMYSVRNYVTFGFFGVSPSAGLSLTGRAAPFLEKAKPEYPAEVEEFLRIRDIRGNNWGARGIKWLMTNRNMTWSEANSFLLRVCTTAIFRAPIRYAVEVGKSLVTFHMPSAMKGERQTLLFLYAVDFAVISAFLILTMVWVSYHFLRILSSPNVKGSWISQDSVILFCQIIYWYCAMISAGIDYGRPEHRTSVLFVQSLLVTLTIHRFRLIPWLFKP